MGLNSTTSFDQFGMVRLPVACAVSVGDVLLNTESGDASVLNPVLGVATARVHWVEFFSRASRSSPV